MPPIQRLVRADLYHADGLSSQCDTNPVGNIGPGQTPKTCIQAVREGRSRVVHVAGPLHSCGECVAATWLLLTASE